MTKSRKGILSAIMCLVMLLIGVCALTACGSKDLTVTFSVEGKTQQVEVVDGKVAEMPADPTKEFILSVAGTQLLRLTTVRNSPKIPK